MDAPTPTIRQNYLANLIAAIACFLIEAAWFSFFLQPWLNGVGRTREWLTAAGLSPAIQYGTALLCAFVLATLLSAFIQRTGRQTILRGIWVAVLAWIGFVVPTWATEYVFEIRSWSIFGINCGVWLVGMVVMGAIIGAWPKKSVAA